MAATSKRCSRILCASILVVLSVAGFRLPAVASEVVAEFHLAGSKAEGVAVVLRAESSTASQVVEWDGTVGTPLRIMLDPSKNWLLTAVVPGLWAEPIEMRRGSLPAAVQFDLRETVPVRLAFVPPKGAGKPEEVGLRFRDSPAEDRAAAGPKFSSLIPCTSDGAEFECTAIVGQVDLRIEVFGYAPLYIWEQHLRRDQTAKLGRHRLRTGGSVVGWVEESPRKESLSIRLSPAMVGAVSARFENQREVLAVDTSPGEAGRFQVIGVAPGIYTLEVFLERTVVGRQEDVEVRDGEETWLSELIRLHLPSPVEVTVSPPVPPDGSRWGFVVFRETAESSSVLERVSEGRASASGSFALEQLEIGGYSIQLASGRTRWLSHGFKVGPNEPTTVFLEVPLAPVEGTLEIGSEGLEAVLLFGGQGGSERIALASDEDGWFEGTLPRAGRWRLEVEGIELPGLDKERLRLDPVDVRLRDDGQPDRLEIRLPNTLLSGRVTYRDGSRPREARVTVWTQRDEQQKVLATTTIDAEGEFLFRGLPEGLHKAEAIARGGAASPATLVTLNEDTEAPELLLVLEDRVTVSGIVASHGQPVAGATIVMWPQGGASIHGSRTVTDHTGRYSVELLEGAATALVSAPARQVSIGSIVVKKDEREEHNFDLSGSTGWIAIEVDASRGETLGAPLTLTRAGGTVGLMDVLQHVVVEQEGDGRLVLPHMESGSYVFCRGAQCEELLLVAGGEITFALKLAAE